ncbi:capsule polysaccharide biosynthesis protein [Apiospora marii]|uniref:Capsule polysaccharide biosynthesis protein n=1 Tax=Apiospora marii TaxID=335849 RepID=A0ABR1SGY3_9PEZI
MLNMKVVTPGIVQLPAHEQDSRTDAELIHYLKNPPPVTHERNVWAFWDGGFDAMKPWTQRNVLGWIRRQGPEWDVRVLDMATTTGPAGSSSPTHAHRFIDPAYLPACFNAGTMTGPTRGQHASDMVRLPLLYLHGGVWLDVGAMLFRRLDDIFWRHLADPECPFEMAVTLFQSRKYAGQCLTGFLGARKGNPFIERWMRVWLAMWEGRTSCAGLREHPLVAPLGLVMGPERQEALDETNKPRVLDMGGDPGILDLGTMTDYLALNIAYERVRLLVDPRDGWDGPRYYRERVHMLDSIDELWKSHEMRRMDELFPLLSLPFRPETVGTDPKQKSVADWVGYILANCSMAKFSQGYWQPGAPVPLAMLWGMPENAGADVKEGTWAAYLRWASLACEQTRFRGRCLESMRLPAEQDEIIYKGLLEA